MLKDCQIVTKRSYPGKVDFFIPSTGHSEIQNINKDIFELSSKFQIRPHNLYAIYLRINILLNSFRCGKKVLIKFNFLKISRWLKSAVEDIERRVGESLKFTRYGDKLIQQQVLHNPDYDVNSFQVGHVLSPSQSAPQTH